MLYRKYFQKRLYLNAHLDDVQLAENARKWLKENHYQLTHDTFSKLHHGMDIDLATQILYLYLVEYKQCGFFNLLNRLPVAHFNNNKKIKFLVVPGMFYQERPELGSDGALFANIARRLGFEVETVKTKSLGAVSDNSPVIRQAIDTNRGRDLWLVSLSRGSLEVRACFQENIKTESFSHVQGWLNINGSCYGTLLADHQLSNWPRRMITRTLCSILDINYKSIKELCASNEQWMGMFSVPEHLVMIHLAAFPFTSNVSLQVQSRYARLRQYGPNDGVVLLKDHLKTPGYLYPIWGVDHMMRSPDMGTLFYKLCYLIQYQCHKEMNHEKDDGDGISFAG